MAAARAMAAAKSASRRLIVTSSPFAVTDRLRHGTPGSSLSPGFPHRTFVQGFPTSSSRCHDGRASWTRVTEDAGGTPSPRNRTLERCGSGVVEGGPAPAGPGDGRPRAPPRADAGGRPRGLYGRAVGCLPAPGSRPGPGDRDGGLIRAPGPDRVPRRRRLHDADAAGARADAAAVAASARARAGGRRPPPCPGAGPPSRRLPSRQGRGRPRRLALRRRACPRARAWRRDRSGLGRLAAVRGRPGRPVRRGPRGRGRARVRGPRASPAGPAAGRGADLELRRDPGPHRAAGRFRGRRLVVRVPARDAVRPDLRPLHSRAGRPHPRGARAEPRLQGHRAPARRRAGGRQRLHRRPQPRRGVDGPDGGRGARARSRGAPGGGVHRPPSRHRQARHAARPGRQARPAGRRRVGVDEDAHRRGGAPPEPGRRGARHRRPLGASLPRALGRRRLSGRPAGRRDPARRADRGVLRRPRRHDHGPLLPQRHAARVGGRRAAGRGREPVRPPHRPRRRPGGRAPGEGPAAPARRRGDRGRGRGDQGPLARHRPSGRPPGHLRRGRAAAREARRP